MHPDSEIIAALGGVKAVAKILGLGKYGAQRVQNWMHRGIPARVKLDRPDLFPHVPVKPPKARKSRKGE
jgi:hypothetical protein